MTENEVLRLRIAGLEKELAGVLKKNSGLEESLAGVVKQNAVLEKSLATLVKKNAELEEKADDKNSKAAQKKYKDRVFRFIFGNPARKEWALSLYNAVNGTNYTDPEEITFNTIGDAVYMRMKNDVSFIIAFEMNLWEHQSSFNPNMPMRFFIYAGRLYEKYIATSDYYQYSSSLQPAPRPKCVCFYNGKQEQPEERILKLSDAFEGEGDIEVQVSMRNINYGKNLRMMEACKPLSEYAWLVAAIRQNQDEKMDLDAAVDAALDAMPEDFVIRGFLLGNRAEVKNMFLTEYDEEKVKEKEREEGRREGIAEGKRVGIAEGKREGIAEGKREGIAEGKLVGIAEGKRVGIAEGKREGIAEGAKLKEAEVNERVARDLLREGMTSVSFISRISRLSEDAVRKLAKMMEVAVL